VDPAHLPEGGDVIEDSLFDDAGYRVPTGPPSTTGQKIRDGHVARILAGFHPLAYLDPTLTLHPLTARVTAPDGRGADDYRCGSCLHRVHTGGNAKSYAKCYRGRTVTPVPDRTQTRGHGPTHNITTPYATGSEQSDVRAWWPACIHWTRRPDPSTPSKDPS
jgi:hypothetical protein